LVLASSLNSIFANFGIALGSATGSFVVENFGLKPLGPSGALYALLAFIVVICLNKAKAHYTKKTILRKVVKNS
jgi:predicted MFS family arabinose efflux permease